LHILIEIVKISNNLYIYAHKETLDVGTFRLSYDQLIFGDEKERIKRTTK